MNKSIFIVLVFFGNLFQPTNLTAQNYVAGGDFDYAPFSFIDKAGKNRGLDIDVLEAIFEGSNIKLNYHLSAWDSALFYIQTGKIDIITGIIFSENRSKFFDFTTPIHTEYYSIFIRSDLPFDNLSSLYDYKPIILDGDISIDAYLIPMGLFKNHLVAASLPEALAGIESGLADYVIAPNILGINEIETNSYKNIEVKGPPIIPSIYCLAVKKGNTLLLNILNQGIEVLRKSGKLYEIQKKWKINEGYDAKYNRRTKIIWFGFIIAILLLTLVFVWVWLLRMRIKQKTATIFLKNQELQKSEEKFRIITENSSDIIWHIDSNFCLTYISPADERIRGFKKEDILGNSLFSILKPEGIELLKEANKKRIIDHRNGIAPVPVIYELEQLCTDGSWVWVEATAMAYFEPDGTISGYHGVTRDISERKKAEKKLLEQEILLREHIATKDKLFSIIAHDLKSPFNAILGFSELLIKNSAHFEADTSKKYSEIINTSAKNTLILLDNLLSWAKAQTGQIIYNPENADLSAIVKEILSMSDSVAKIKDITLKFNQTGDIEVYADTDMLKTILRNLISNAIKFTYPNGKITVYATQNQNSIELAVSDNGIGMSEETQNKLFVIDKESITLGTADEKGSGLGLILCKEFIEKHGGKLWVESEIGKGSTFKFTLPLLAAFSHPLH
ncbi:MAG: transporter substrate-binding domain-containing protein [Salinivirgaceae bacterium]|nr:transporter substrate-binding domain-containing protein [Salinivirgaceae bacterium]